MIDKRFILICLMLFFLSSPIVLAQNKGAQKLVINGGKPGNITLTHQLHQDRIEDCSVCHSSFAQKRGALDEAKENGTIKKKQLMTNTCLKCHRDNKKAGNAYGPVKCSGCHIK